MLTCLDILIGHILKHQRIGIAQEAGHRRIRSDLIEEEKAPVITIGHGQFAIGKSQPVEHLIHHLLVIVHQGVGLPLLCTRSAQLEHLERQSSLAQLLHHHILVAGVEEIMVL